MQRKDHRTVRLRLALLLTAAMTVLYAKQTMKQRREGPRKRLAALVYMTPGIVRWIRVGELGQGSVSAKPQ